MVNHIAAGIGIAAGLLGTYMHAKEGGSTDDKLGRVVESFIGVNPAGDMKFRWQQMKFTIPAAGGIAISVIAAKTGANRYTPKGVNI